MFVCNYAMYVIIFSKSETKTIIYKKKTVF